MAKREEILSILKETYPTGETALAYDTPFQLLCAVILSAQCTDAQVNKVTRVLFKKYPDAESMSKAPLEDIRLIIRSTGYFNNKAMHLSGTSKMIAKNYDGEVPNTMEELLTLPGVARKTANVVLSVIFNKAEGIVVDTHVHRVSRRLGLSTAKSPNTTEKQLLKKMPKKDWIWYSLALIQHGRQVCDAKKPKCDKCPLKHICPSAFDFKHF